MSRIPLLTLLGVLFSLRAYPAGLDFSGTWAFNPNGSRNIGAMSSMKLTTVIEQSASKLIQNIDATMMGQHEQQQVTFDLSGKNVPNETPMGEKSDTITKREGARLITTWTTAGAVPGTTTVSTETRYLSADGKKMYVETAGKNGKPAVIMAYDKK